MKNIINLLFAFTMTVCFEADAFRIKGTVWFLSETVTNANIYAFLYNAEEAAKIGDNLKAAKILDNLSSNEFVKGYITTDNEPLDLALASASLWYRAEYAKNKDTKIIAETEKTISKWAEKAKGNRWESYKKLYHRIRAYHIKNCDFKNLFNVQKKMILYDVFDKSQLDSLESYFEKYPEYVDEMSDFINEFKKRGGTLTPSLELALICESEISDEKKFKAIMSWLKEHHNANLGTIEKGVNKGVLFLSVKKPEWVRIFHDTLTDIALWQPGSDDRMPVIAYLINERSKIEAILPEANK